MRFLNSRLLPMLAALTGMAGGLDLFEIISLLGPESTFARIEHGMRRLAD